MINYQFLKPLTSDRLEFIKLDFVVTDKTKNIDDLLNAYVVSNMWRGKFFIKKLIKRLFKYRVNGSFNWDKNFWKLICIENLEYQYKLPNDINNLDELKQRLIKKTTKNRMNDIVKYQQLLRDGININVPLFITGEVLNHLGAEANSSEIYFLDGSRRLLANILNNNLHNKALLINLK